MCVLCLGVLFFGALLLGCAIVVALGLLWKQKTRAVYSASLSMMLLMLLGLCTRSVMFVFLPVSVCSFVYYRHNDERSPARRQCVHRKILVSHACEHFVYMLCVPYVSGVRRLFALGFTTFFGGAFLKNWRLHRIFHKAQLIQMHITNTRLALRLLALLVFDLVRVSVCVVLSHVCPYCVRADCVDYVNRVCGPSYQVQFRARL